MKHKRTRTFFALLILISLSTVFASNVFAESKTIIVEQKLDSTFEDGKNYEIYFGAEQTVGYISRDFVLTLTPYVGTRFIVPALFNHRKTNTTAQLELAGPMNILLNDSPPKESNVGIRRSDWDTISDFLSIVSVARFGEWHDPFFIEFGKINNYTLGHGSFVQNYANTVNRNKKEFGLQFHTNANGINLDFFLDDFSDPDLIGGRFQINPFHFVYENPILDSIGFGFTFIDHVRAPFSLQTLTNKFIFGQEFLPKVSRRESNYLWGFDVEIESIQEKNVLLKHYIDLNFVNTNIGFHLGSEIWFRPTNTLGFNFKAELATGTANYQPYYVGMNFEFDQFIFPGWLNPVEKIPLSQVVMKRNESSVGGIIGGAISYLDYFSLGIVYEGHTGPKNDRLSLELRVNPIEEINAALIYYNQNGEIGLDLINPVNAFISAELNATVWGPVYLVGRYNRKLLFQKDEEQSSINEFDIGVGLYFSY